jgi:iron complex transport system ATP-binding protein
MIEFVSVSACQQQHRALECLNLRISAGERVAILGPNGAGKSTLLKLISREIYPIESPGSALRLFGSSTLNLWDLRSRIGFVSQDLQEDYTPFTTAVDVVVSGFFGSIGTHEHLQPNDAQLSKARTLLATVDMAVVANRMYQRLSTGQKRRLLLARALVHEPQALILDEPTSGLDMGAASGLLGLLRGFCETGRSLLITTHHLDEVIPEIERVVLLHEGRIVADGAKAEVLTSDILSDLYQVRLKVTEREGWYRCWQP